MAKRSKASRAAVRGWQTRRRAAAARSAAAERGWQTRRRHERIKQAQQTIRKRRRHALHEEPPRTAHKRRRDDDDDDMTDHLVSFRFDVGGRSYRRDLVVPAARGSSIAAIVKQARRELPAGAETLRPFLTLAHAEIIEGPRTSRRRTESR